MIGWEHFRLRSESSRAGRTRAVGIAASRLALSWGRAALDFLYPPVCPLCYERLAAEDRTLCARCLASLVPRPDWECPRCGALGMGASPAPGRRCRLCPPPAAAWQGALSVTGYSESAAQCVRLFKYQRRFEIGRVMARLMADQLAERAGRLGGRLNLVAPVPLHWLRRVGRGFNQSLPLARALATATGLPCDRRLLRRVRYTRRQALVPRERRAANVRGAFALRPGRQVRDLGILLVDDVVTTGETINECAKALMEAEAREIWVASFARAGMGSAEEAL